MKRLAFALGVLLVCAGCSGPSVLDAARKFQAAEEAFRGAQTPEDFLAVAARYQEILALQPGHVAVMNNLAWALSELKDPAALGYAEKAHAKAPADPNIQDTYGWLLFNSGDEKRGIALLTQAATAAPKSPEVRMHLAKALLKTGDKAAAKRELEAVVQFAGKSPLKAEAEQLLQAP